MKIDYKKITALASSALMVGMTAGVAAAANYPQPFVDSDGDANVAVVYGSDAASTDAAAAQNIVENLKTFEETDDGEVTIGGESVKMERSSDKFNLGDNMNDVFLTSVDEDDLSDLLAEMDFSGDSDEYTYTQKISPSSVTLEHFADKDYDDKEPAIGFHLKRDEPVLNYTLQFSSSPDFTEDEMKNEEITMLGKEYYILGLTNASDHDDNGKITLLDSGNSATVSLGETKTIDGKEITMEWVEEGNVELTVDGESASLSSVGDTDKLSDGNYVALKKTYTSGKESLDNKAEIVLGKGKLELEDSSEVKLNGDSVDYLNAHIDASTGGSGSPDTLNSISLEWRADEESFVTQDSELTMPALASVKLSMTDFVAEEMETINLENDGDNGVILTAPIEDGTVEIPVLSQSEDSLGKFDRIGDDSDSKLYTSETDSITDINVSEENAYVVASWSASTEGESYYLELDTTKDGSTHKAVIENVVTGESKEVQSGSEGTFGNVVIDVDDVNDTSRMMDISLANSDGTSFNELYTEEGAKIYLPYDSGSEETGAIDLASDPQSWTLNMTEEDKDGYVGAGGSLTATVGFNTENETTVKDVGASKWAAESGDTYEIGSSDNYEGYVASELASRMVHDTGGDQDSVEITYNGEQSYGDVYISSSETTKSSDNGSSDVAYITDDEVSDYSDTNLIVVGGSCINSAAASLVGGDYCGSDFTDATDVGDGEFIIKGYSDSDVTDELALLVAGYNATDTANAATYLRNRPEGDVETGKTYTGTSSTTATLETTESD